MASDSRNLIALPPGFRLGEYRIERYLGSGGFGITYAAIDENLNRRVAIKEYLPKTLAMRDADARVTFATVEDEDDFRWGLDRFLDEARALARFDHPNIVSVERFIEAHGTGYIVMEHVDGESLSELLKRKPTLTEAEIRENVLPVAAGLDEVHRAGLLHRDIKPGNIVVRANGVPVLIDFGSARHETSAKSRSLTAVITPGYAPLEQYSSSLGDERPATDIYAFGAVLYRCVTGDSPPDATDRALEDRLMPAAEAADGIYSPGLLTAMDAALRMRTDERPRDIAAFLQLMSTGDIGWDQPEDTGATCSETAQAVGVGSGTSRAGRNASRSGEAGSPTNREKTVRSSGWQFVASAIIIAVISGAFVFAIFLDLSGGEWRASDGQPAPDVTSERPSLGEPLAPNSWLVDRIDQFTGNQMLAVVVTADDYVAPENEVTFGGLDRILMFVCNTEDPDSNEVAVAFKPGLIYQNGFPAVTEANPKTPTRSATSLPEDGQSQNRDVLISEEQRRFFAWELLKMLSVKIRFGFDRAGREVDATWDDSLAGAVATGESAGRLLLDAWRNETLLVTVGDAKPMRFELEQARANLLSFKRRCDAL